MNKYVRHELDSSFENYKNWCNDPIYKQIKDENREDYSANLALCKNTSEEGHLLFREHKRYLEIWQDRDEANFYEREKATKVQASQQAMAKAKSQFGGCLVMGLIICCPPAWPFAIMMLIFGGLSGRYSKPPRRR